MLIRRILGAQALVTLGLAHLFGGVACGGNDKPVPSGAPASGAGGTGASGTGTSATGTGTGVGGDTGAGGSSGDDDGGGTGGGPGTDDSGTPKETVTLRDDITANTTWTADKVWVIPKLKRLFVKNGATLTIEPGTVVKGSENSVLVITRGSKIHAEGTPTKPIVLTAVDGMRRPGRWGGLLVLGGAPINSEALTSPPSAESTYEAFSSGIPEAKFGGTNPHDNSGVLKYVRVEFGGYAFQMDKEFNNLTLAGVGDGTTVDYVQAHRGSDDGVEIFGGTVNVKHLVSSQNEDDGFDTDNGWQGKAQFIVVQHLTAGMSLDPSNGYESDNHGDAASYKAPPRTLPTVYNATLIGGSGAGVGKYYAATLRRGTGGKYYNQIFTAFAEGVLFRDVATKEQLDAGNLFIKNSIFNQPFALPDMVNGMPDPFDIVEATYIMDASWANQQVDPGLTADAFSFTAPKFAPAAGAPALTGGATPPDDGFFDPTATFVGAVGSEDWTQGWTAYPQPQ